jgi:hypothetical protein
MRSNRLHQSRGIILSVLGFMGAKAVSAFSSAIQAVGLRSRALMMVTYEHPVYDAASPTFDTLCHFDRLWK